MSRLLMRAQDMEKKKEAMLGVDRVLKIFFFYCFFGMQKKKDLLWKTVIFLSFFFFFKIQHRKGSCESVCSVLFISAEHGQVIPVAARFTAHWYQCLVLVSPVTLQQSSAPFRSCDTCQGRKLYLAKADATLENLLQTPCSVLTA